MLILFLFIRYCMYSSFVIFFVAILPFLLFSSSFVVFFAPFASFFFASFLLTDFYLLLLILKIAF